MSKYPLLGMTLDELQSVVRGLGMPKFAAKQIASWLYDKKVNSIDEMTNLSKGLREKLKENYEIRKVKMIDHQISKVDPTEKFLFELEDGNMVESVLMKYNYGNSVCISSQAGCRMGCRS